MSMNAAPRKASPRSGSPVSNGASGFSSSPVSNGGASGYSKSDKKNTNMLASKSKWYALTAILVMAVIILAVDKKSAWDDSDSSAKVSSSTKNSKSKSIRQISILGERNSGTRWTYAHLSTCFNHTLKVKRDLTRYKHWFQNRNESRYSHDTLVIAQFRNPYDWLEAMRKVPHHSPAHIDLEWMDFLTKEWTTERIGEDLNITDFENPICQEKFKYKDIVSCLRKPLPNEAYENKLRYSENQPFYEMRNDGSGKPYNNIMEMRADKIRNFLSVKDFEGVRDVWVTQYEYLLAKGTKGMLDKISEWTGVPYECKPYPIQNRRRRPLTKEFADFLNENLDWEAEALVGYQKERTG